MHQSEKLVYTPFEELSSQAQESLRMAQKALELAYPNPMGPPIHVGAIVRTKQGRRYAGASLAVTGQRLSLCAEQLALGAAHMGKDRENCVEIAVVLRNERNLSAPPSFPCGGCLQMINDFAEASGIGGEFRILAATPDLAKVVVTTLQEDWKFRYRYHPTPAV